MRPATDRREPDDHLVLYLPLAVFLLCCGAVRMLLREPTARIAICGRGALGARFARNLPQG
jgi:hypothetical protein